MKKKQRTEIFVTGTKKEKNMINRKCSLIADTRGTMDEDVLSDAAGHISNGDLDDTDGGNLEM